MEIVGRFHNLSDRLHTSTLLHSRIGVTQVHYTPEVARLYGDRSYSEIQNVPVFFPHRGLPQSGHQRRYFPGAIRMASVVYKLLPEGPTIKNLADSLLPVSSLRHHTVSASHKDPPISHSIESVTYRVGSVESCRVQISILAGESQ